MTCRYYMYQKGARAMKVTINLPDLPFMKGGGKKPSKSAIKGFALGIATMAVFAATPAYAGVTDNLDSSFTKLASVMGVGKEAAYPTSEDEFDAASLIEKVNYLEAQNKQLTEDVSSMTDTLSAIYKKEADMEAAVKKITIATVSKSDSKYQVKAPTITKTTPFAETIQWTNVNASSEPLDSSVMGYRIYRKPASGGTYDLVATLTQSSYDSTTITYAVTRGTSGSSDGYTTFNATGGSGTFTYTYTNGTNLSPATDYTYWVTTLMDEGDTSQDSEGSLVQCGSKYLRENSYAFNSVTDKTQALSTLQPSGVTVAMGSTAGSSVKVTWTAAGDAASYVSGYNVYLYTNSSYSGTAVKSATNTSSGVQFTGLTAGTTYYAKVRAVLKSGLTASGEVTTDANNKGSGMCGYETVAITLNNFIRVANSTYDSYGTPSLSSFSVSYQDVSGTTRTATSAGTIYVRKGSSVSYTYNFKFVNSNTSSYPNVYTAYSSNSTYNSNDSWATSATSGGTATVAKTGSFTANGAGSVSPSGAGVNFGCANYTYYLATP